MITDLLPYFPMAGQIHGTWPRGRQPTPLHCLRMHKHVPFTLSPLLNALAGGPVVSAGRPLRVMIVEDEAIIAMDLEMTLQDLGVEVVCIAESASDAVRLAEQYRPDCATMDINIAGDQDGISAAIQLYQAFGVRSIFISAYGNSETRDRAASANAIDWISKPFSEAELKRILDEFAGDL